MKNDESYRAALWAFRSLLNASENVVNQPLCGLGKFEAYVAAMSLIRLSLRNSWAIHDLGQISADHYVAAATCARSAFETGAVAAWLLLPDDPFESEGRWLGWLKANERFYTSLANDLASTPELSSALRQTAQHNRDWRTAIEAKLPQRTTVVLKPNMPEILRELGFLPLYSTYRGMSQIIHAEPDAVSLVHKAEYTPRDSSETRNVFEAESSKHWFGHFYSEKSWWLPMSMTVWALMISLPALLSKLNAGDLTHSLFEEQDTIRAALERLKQIGDTRPN